MHANELSFLPLLIVISLAFFVPILLSGKKINFLPVVIGEIIGGIIVGKSGFGLVTENEVLTILSELGFVYLMFLSGLEIDLDVVTGFKREKGVSKGKAFLMNPLFQALSFFIFTGLLAFGFAGLMMRLGFSKDVWLMTLIFTTNSLGIAVPVLKEKDLFSSRYGQMILIAAIVTDFLSILLFSIFVMIKSKGLSIEILLVLILIIFFMVIYRIAAMFQNHSPTKRLFEKISGTTSQVQLRGSLALTLVFVVMAHSMGIENIVGAFLAGVIISIVSGGEGSIFKQKLDAIGYGFFIPIFFIMIGVNFDLPVLFASKKALLLVPVLVLIAYVVKIIPAFIFRSQFSLRETFAAGFLLSARLSLIIAMAAIGFNMGLISSEINSAIVLVAIITCTLSPIFFNLLAPKRKIDKNTVVIIGCRQFAEVLTKRLWNNDEDAVLVCVDDFSSSHKAPNDKGRIRFQEILISEMRKIGVDKAKAVVAMGDSDDENLKIARIAKQIFNVKTIIAWVQNAENNLLFREFGVRIVNPAYSTLLFMEGMIMNPDAFSNVTDIDQSLYIQNVKLKNEEFVGTPVEGLELPQDMFILQIKRGDANFIPDRDTLLRANDTLLIAGPDDKMPEHLMLIQSFSKA